MNGISEYHERRIYSSSNHYGFIYQLLQIEYFTKVDAQVEEIEVHFSDNFGRDLVEQPTRNWTKRTDIYTVSFGQGKIFKIVPS